jgi:hypothetical protein
MKIKFVFFAVVALFTALLAAFIITNWNKHIIFLSSGKVIEADRVWVINDDVYYEKGYGTLEKLKTDNVDQIVSADFSSIDDWKIILAHKMSSQHGVFKILSMRMAWIGILFAFGLYVFASLFRRLLELRLHKTEKTDEKKEVRVIHISPQLSDFKKVLLYFLNLYFLQAAADKKDKFEYQLLEIKGPMGTSVYEFRINKGGKWHSRRISMGRIGEESGARSKCFYVIYDDHFVVKIPPDAIADFDEYIKSINADRRIAEILSPRKCLVARMGIVLKKVPGFADFVGRFPGDEEGKCIAGLKTSPEFQELLKIAGSFAFFVDLSKHFFLGGILKDFHDPSSLIEKELEKNLEMIWHPDAFVNRYGEDAIDICFELQKMFNRFDDQLNSLSVPEFQKKSWFKSIFMDNPQEEDTQKNLPQAVNVIDEIQGQYSDTMNAYTKILQKIAHEQTFGHNIPRIQNICTQMLELLAWLFFKEVAIRDLKPDNMIVVGDPAKFPQFLDMPDGFELGLIDLEIAAFVGSGENRIDQPKLGWTPFYATPTHMFLNSVLKNLYNDVAYILKLQDWYAAVAICYETVTGEKLFVSTAKIISSLAKELPGYFDDPAKMKQFAKKAGAKFWPNAAKEFEFKIMSNKSILTAVSIDLLKNTKKMLTDTGFGSKNENIRSLLTSRHPKINAYDLIRLMFEHVKESMFEEKWMALVSNSRRESNGNSR